jgi:hypothetical protein
MNALSKQRRCGGVARFVQASTGNVGLVQQQTPNTAKVVFVDRPAVNRFEHQTQDWFQPVGAAQRPFFT